MLESNIGRGQGIEDSGAATGTIELGIFQQALRESIAFSNDTSQKSFWGNWLQNSTVSAIEGFENATADAGLPLDRLSVGSSMIYQRNARNDEAFTPAIKALQESVKLQQRNANGGFWYYANPNNLSAYHNLSYSDGMFSYPLFAILSADEADPEDFGAAAALKQIQILYDICKNENGLVVHGYDASKDHKWANPKTGASPAVWGRSLSWFTLGILNSLDALQAVGDHSDTFRSLKTMFNDLVNAQLSALDRSLQTEGVCGVWQLVERPGATFGEYTNYVEASASSMTAYSLLRGARLGFVEDTHRAVEAGLGIYGEVLDRFLIENQNGTLSLNGTSSVATLSGDVDYAVSLHEMGCGKFVADRWTQYYASRPTVLNSLIGTSAFILAGLENDRIC